MLPVACGACGVSALSMGFPPFEAWMTLLPVAFVIYHFSQWRGGEFKSSQLVSHLVGGLVALFAAAAMLAVLVFPIFFLAALLGLLGQLRFKDKWSRIAVGAVLLSFILSAAWTFRQAKLQGDAWKLGRIQGGSPGIGFVNRAVKENRFSEDQLLSFLQSENSRVVRNSAQIVQKKLEIESERSGVKPFAREVEALHKSGKVNLEPEVLEACRAALRVEEPAVQASPTPDVSSPLP